MPEYRLEIPPQVAEVIRHLPPELKRAVKGGIRALAANPAAGEPLQGELRGRYQYRVRRFRIVYRVDKAKRMVRVLAVGHRRSVYEEVAQLLRAAKDDKSY